MQDHPYRNICSVRRDASASLVQLRFDMLTPAEADTHNGVPAGLPFCVLQAQMAQLELVFLSRFVFEVLRYINLLLRLRPPPLGEAEAAQGPEQQGSRGQVSDACVHLGARG